MNRGELIRRVSQVSGYSQTVVSDIVNAFSETIISEVSKGEAVMIRGFGTFRTRIRKSKRIWDLNVPGGECILPEKTVPVFIPSGYFSERVSKE